ncbi:MAG: hypothetical protein U0441_13055 [Polyangiaceae bacterium]
MDPTFFVTAGALLSAGFSKDVGVGLTAGGGAQLNDFFSVAAEIRGMLPAEVRASDPIDTAKPVLASKKIDLSDLSGLLVPCFRLSIFLGCAVGKVGVVMTRSTTLNADSLSFATGPRLGVNLRFFDRLDLSGYAEALLTTAPSTVSYQEVNALWQQSLVSAFFGVNASVLIK